ncbi:MAG TPA: tetratricopeptide repeat protein [Bdellovibrionota bacterium]|nr:tetratricopeptide repeat protein [Bdellovibrionota bacterium]
MEPLLVRSNPQTKNAATLRKGAHLEWVSFVALFCIFWIAGCGPKRPHYMGPGHDADWPIEAPDAPAYESFLEGQRYSAQGHVDEAIEALEATLKNDPKSPYLLVQLADEVLRKGDFTRAEQLATAAAASKPDDREAHFLLGKIYGAQKQWDKSEDEFKKVVALDPSGDEEAVIALATVYVESKRPEKAVAVLEALTQANPDHLLGYYYLGRVYSELDRFDDAIRAYEKAVAINPVFSSALRAIALIYEYQGKKDEAVETLQRVLDIEIDNANVRNHLGQLYLERNDLDSALKQFEIVARDHPKDVTARLRIGLIYLQRGDYKEAEKILRELLKDAPELQRVRYYLGVVMEKLGDKPGARKQFEAIDIQADIHIDSQLAIAYLQESEEDFKGAERTLRTSLKQHPNSPELTAGLAANLLKQKREKESLQLLQEAVAASPKDETLWFSLGEVHDKMGNTEKLYEAMKTVLEINPDNANALNYLGYTYAEKGIKLDEAEHLVTRALEIKPKDGYITDSLGWVYYRRGHYEKAVAKLEEAQKLTPDDPTILEHLGDALEKNGKKERALEMYQRALQFAREPEAQSRIRDKIAKLSPKKTSSHDSFGRSYARVSYLLPAPESSLA